MSISLQLLCFPEFGRALLAVNDEGVALVDVPVAVALVSTLQEALPLSSLRRASIYVEEIEAAWGFKPPVFIHFGWGQDAVSSRPHVLGSHWRQADAQIS
ncbi:MAG: hypothetical protein O3A14_15930, partial [Cyanobacteria bacterium]|nr:hypothetical protein [Cyanobacteriota bacterium]